MEWSPKSTLENRQVKLSYKKEGISQTFQVEYEIPGN